MKSKVNYSNVKIISTSFIYTHPSVNKYDFKTYTIFRPISFFYTIIRKVWLVFFNESFWYDKWVNEIKNGDVVIVHATNHFSERIIDYLAENYKDLRVIHWFWNPVFVYPQFSLKKDNCEQWSFDSSDCKKYGMLYNTTYYFNKIKLPDLPVTNDVFFIGFNKGRKSKIELIEGVLSNMGCSTDFIVIEDDDRSGLIPYIETLHIMAKSKLILDIVQEGQTGMSLRPMESIFFNKKLITTDLNISSEDFYSKDNIFIWGRDNVDDLKSFVEKPYNKIDSDIVEKYDIISWLNRFIK